MEQEKPYRMHWLHGKIEFNVWIERETLCRRCLHVQVCSFNREKLCSNWSFGRSDAMAGCGQCNHVHTRGGRKDCLPCFHCKYQMENPEYVDKRDPLMIESEASTAAEWDKTIKKSDEMIARGQTKPSWFT